MTSLARVALRSCVALAAALAVLPAGCTSTRELHGSSGIEATYIGGKLIAYLPGETAPMSVLAAASEEFVRRGYTVKDIEGTEDAGTVTAWPPRTNDFPRMVVGASKREGFVRVTLEYVPFGDEPLSRAVFGRILEKLGL